MSMHPPTTSSLRKQIGSFTFLICLLCLSLASPAIAGITYPAEAGQISTTTGLRPQIAIDPQDRATIVYEHDNYIWAVKVQADGSAGIPVQISKQSKPGAQVALYPEVVVDSQGVSTVVWARIDPASGASVGEFARLTVQGTVIGATQQFSSNTYQPELAIDAQDRVTVVWGDMGTIRAMRISSNGAIGAANVLATAQNIVGGETNGKHRFALAADAQGRVSVAWAAADSSGTRVVVKARTIAANGSTMGTIQEVSSSGLFFIGAIDSAVAPDGRVGVIWHQTTVRLGDGQIFMRTLDPDGGVTAAPVRLNSLSGNGGTPRIEADRFGRWLAVWATKGNSELRQETRLIDASGNLGAITPQSQAGAYSNRAEIKADSCGRWVMQWESSSDGTFESNRMFAARLDSAGVMQGAPVMISSLGDVDEIHDVAVDSRNNALHVWTSGDLNILLSRGVDNGSDEGCYDETGGGEDTSVDGFAVAARKSQRQKGPGVAIMTSVSADEEVTVNVTGTIKIKGTKGRFKIKPVTRIIKDGNQVTLGLKLAKKKDVTTVSKAIRIYRKTSRKQKKKIVVTAAIRMKATDAAGNIASMKRKVTLR